MTFVGDEAVARRRLRTMKTVATGLLVLAVATYAVARHYQAGGPAWVGYLAAAAEAGTVGALADWFAVTALFRRPLGLPIPHTAIIPTRKDAIGESLERFVSANFLSEPVVRDKIAQVEAAARLGGWLADPSHARRVTDEAAPMLRTVVANLHDEQIRDLLAGTVLPRLAEWPIGPAAGRLLAEIVAEGSHHRLVDLVIDAVDSWLRENRRLVLDIVLAQAPSWSPRLLDDVVSERIYHELTRFIREIKLDQGHNARTSVDAFLARFAADLQSDPATMDNAEKFKERVLGHPDLPRAFATMWTSIKKVLLDALDNPGSELRTRFTEVLVSFGVRLNADPELRARIDGWITDSVVVFVNRNGAELVGVISDTVKRWDATETARKIEVQVGRDLQFIRVNGTVVGALAGLAIHAVTAAFT
jgi:uncharacterized membrane-anchored protein YjiN (DUF445 family)